MKILVGYDGSNSSKEALNQAKIQAKAFDGEIHLVTSHKQDSYQKEEKKHVIGKIETELEHQQQSVIQDGIACESHLLITGLSPSEDLLEFAEERNIDLIVIGVRRRSQVGKLMFGSTAHPIILNSKCPVLSVK